jgi:hypothetical protein
MTEPYCEAVGHKNGNTPLEWSKSSIEYPSIGIVKYEVALLSGYRNRIPAPPKLPNFVVEKSIDNFEIVIHTPLKSVYQTLINLDKRPEWIDGVDTIQHEMTYERINMKHNCKFMGKVIINTAIHSDFREDYALYSEHVEIPEMDLTMVVHYELFAQNEDSIRLNFNVNWLGANLPEESKQGMMQAQAINLGNLKELCEKVV